MNIRLDWRVLATALCLVLFGCKDAPDNHPNPDLIYNAPNDTAKTVVVFVHGILGNAASTFKSDAAPQGWPEMLATDHSVAEPVNVISLGYASQPLDRASNINEIATRLRARLTDLNVFSRYSKVVFVTHSMGGLVTKRMLLQLSQDDRHAFEKVAGVFFFATPAGGSSLASLSSWISKNPQFGNMAPADMNVFLQAEEDDWSAMLHRRTQQAPYPRTFCAYETQAVGGTVVVPRSDAQQGCDDRSLPFDRNHLSLVKPKDRSDEVYTYLLARLNRLIKNEYVPLTITATLLSPNGRSIPTPATLFSGMQYALQIQATQASWFYVVCENSDGTVQRYFPSEALGKQTTAQSALTLPENKHQKFTLDNHKGIEKIHIFASSHNDDRLMAIDAEIMAKPKQGLQIVQRALRLRNSFLSDTLPTNGKSDKVSVTDFGGEPATSLIIMHQ